jgi:hypothetical protein
VEPDDLYDMPLDRFVPERAVLVRELRKAGRSAEAGEVTGLRKPSVAAWAVNQLVRTQGRAVAELLEAGDALRAAHEDVLAGRGDSHSLRAAVERERTAVDTLTSAARGLLTSQGHDLSATIIERVADTLNAAALDEEARKQVRGGRLVRELRHVGLGSVATVGGAPEGGTGEARGPGAARGEGEAGGAGEARGASKARGQKQSAPAEQAEAKARAAARAAEREAGRRADRAERMTKMAEDRQDQAAEALEEAEADLDAAQEELHEAQKQLSEAQRALRELGK